MTRQNHKRGFNLIEAAFVLAVVGGVIGGIWVSAAAVYENHKVNKTADGLLLTAHNMQNLFSMRDIETIGIPAYIRPALVAAGAFPADWVADGKGVTSQIGGISWTGWADGAGGGNIMVIANGGSIRISQVNLNQSSCVKLASKFSSLTMQDIIDAVEIYGLDELDNMISHYVTGTFPISLTSIQDACKDVKNNTLSLFIKLTRRN